MIVSELKELGFTVKQVTNVIIKKKGENRSDYARTPLPLFFVDLEKTEKVEDIFKFRFLAYCRVKVEELYKRREVGQCQQCQQYGRKLYCNHAPKCIRCAGSHLTKTCTTSQHEPVKCALYVGIRQCLQDTPGKTKEIRKDNQPAPTNDCTSPGCESLISDSEDSS